MIDSSKSGHLGGALGIAEIMAVLYFEKMNHQSHNANWADRDRFVLSNGHTCAALYSALARTGYFPVEELLTFRKLNSRLQGHPCRHELPGIETAAGPLGQGLSIANGIALGVRADNSDANVYCLVGDGELQEGQFWEAVMTSAHYKLNNLALIVNWNGLQIDGSLKDVKSIEPLPEKFQAFGWEVIEIDGHNIQDVRSAFEKFSRRDEEKPCVIIAQTLMAKGVSFMEDQAIWHGKVPSVEETKKALEELGMCKSFAELSV